MHTRPHQLSKHGEGSGARPVNLQANYFRLLHKPSWQISKYHVTFEPEVLQSGLRKALVRQHKEMLGGYLFDGSQLFLIRSLEQTNLELKSTALRDNVEYKLMIQYTTSVESTQIEYMQILNLILRFAMNGLQLKLVNRNFFDPQAKVDFPQFHIQLWPGYNTSIRQHESGILLNAEITNKVMRTDTVYDVLKQTLKSGQNLKIEFPSKVLGLTVLTDYNNETYRIDDVDFDKSPRSTFKKKDEEISFLEYYKSVSIKKCSGLQRRICEPRDFRASILSSLVNLRYHGGSVELCVSFNVEASLSF